MSSLGKVFLVGAGPGDPELISLKGVKSLQKADVVIYDRLVNSELLSYAPTWSELIYMGKESENHHFLQQEINALMIERASEGKTVVRLKGGDPFVFGRGGEECLALAEAGIPFEVVPGISSALSVPAYAGIPVTHRTVAQSFTVITGYASGDDPLGEAWNNLPLTGTVVILMGMQHIAELARRLVQQGRSETTPAAVIRCGTTDAQDVVTGTLADIAVKSRDMRPPAVIVIGEVVGLREQINRFTPTPYSIPTSTTFNVKVQE